MKKLLKKYLHYCLAFHILGFSFAEAYEDGNAMEVNSHLQNRYLHQNYNHCVKEYITKLKEVVKSDGNCQLSESLNIDWTTQYYPRLNATIKVRYWRGAYKKDMLIERTYLRELVDECRGRLLSERKLKDVTYSSLEYAVLNPNLDQEISKSYLLFPMTNEEALIEFKNTLNRCEERQE